MLQLTQSFPDAIVADDPLRIFVGVDETKVVQFRVLEYSIRKSASIPVEISPMANLPAPSTLTTHVDPLASLSFYRLMIPTLAGYLGRALYLDAESVVLGDVAELAALPFDGHSMLCTPGTVATSPCEAPRPRPSIQQTALLVDCDRVGCQIEELARLLQNGDCVYEELLEALCTVVPEDVANSVPVEWSHDEHYEPGVTKLLHFGNGIDQPRMNDRNALGAIWVAFYEEAADCGAVTPGEIEAAVRSGCLSSSLQRILPLRSHPERVSTRPSCQPALVGLGERSEVVRLPSSVALSERTIRRHSIRAYK